MQFVPPAPPTGQPFGSLPMVNPQIQGDPATRQFAIVFLATLALVTIGVGIAIGVGNISHYRYFSPYSQLTVNNTMIGNLTFRSMSLEEDLPFWLAFYEQLDSNSNAIENT